MHVDIVHILSPITIELLRLGIRELWAIREITGLSDGDELCGCGINIITGSNNHGLLPCR